MLQKATDVLGRFRRKIGMSQEVAFTFISNGLCVIVCGGGLWVALGWDPVWFRAIFIGLIGFVFIEWTQVTTMIFLDLVAGDAGAVVSEEPSPSTPEQAPE